MKLPRSRYGRWTAERDAYLAAEYPKNVPLDDLLKALNAMPGFPINGTQIQDRAGKVLMVYRSGRTKPAAPTPIVLERAPFQLERLRPLPKMTRDGFISAAWRDSTDPEPAVPVSAEDVKLWASQHAKAALKEPDLLAATNEVRMSFGLPPFRIVEMRQGRLPPAWFGSDGERPRQEKSLHGDYGD